jgi:hypothetical protein
MEHHGESLGVLRLIGRSFRLLAAQFGFLFPLAFAPSLALSAIAYALGGDPTEVGPEGLPVLGWGALLALFFNVLIGFVVTGVMCLAALDAALGKRHTIGEYLSQTLRHIGPIVVLGLLLSVATGFGMVLALLPGLYVVARWLPWAPAIVFENAGWSGLGRAQELTEGYRWPLVGAATLIGLAVLAVLLLAGPLLGAAFAMGPIGVAVEAAFAGLYYALIAVFTALVYVRLREIKEGVAATEIAETIS